MNQQFGKEYKLCNKQQIDALFAEGRAQKQYPLLVRYNLHPLNSTTSFQIVIAAPKRTFKTATTQSDQTHLSGSSAEK